jgi:hypothetical protein
MKPVNGAETPVTTREEACQGCGLHLYYLDAGRVLRCVDCDTRHVQKG